MSEIESLSKHGWPNSLTRSITPSTLYNPSPANSYANVAPRLAANQATSAQSHPQGQRHRAGQIPIIAPSTPAELGRKAQTTRVQGSLGGQSRWRCAHGKARPTGDVRPSLGTQRTRNAAGILIAFRDEKELVRYGFKKCAKSVIF